MIRCAACGAALAPDLGCPTCGATVDSIDGFPSFAPALAHKVAGYDEAHFSHLVRDEAASSWFQNRNALITSQASLHFPSASHIHEVGCGTGFVLQGLRGLYPRSALSASDALIEGLRTARSRVPSASFFQADVTRLPFQGSFDLVGAFDVLEHLADDVGALEQIRHALVPKGGVIVTVPQHPALWSSDDVGAGHVRRYARGELERKLRHSGFEVLRSTSFVTLLLPAMFIKRQGGATAEAHSQVAQSTWVERAMRWAFRVERTVIAAGASLPIGGSRVVVARRAD